MEIIHDLKGQKFHLKENDGAFLGYTIVNKILDLHILTVPEELRGQGIAEKLSLFAFEWAKEHEFTIIPSCPYIKDKFLKEHPEWTEITQENYFPEDK